MLSKPSPFHLAIPVDDLERDRTFYREVLGCEEGRSSNHWVDLNFFGHQLVLHLKNRKETNLPPPTNAVDGKEVPIPHFGIVLPWKDFHHLVEQLKIKQVKFEIEPYIRFKGKAGEQSSLFFYDPSKNALEFKSFKNINQLFNK